MEHGPFEDVFPIDNGDKYSIAMLVYWRMIQGDTNIEKMLSLDSVDRSFFLAFYHFGELEENRTNWSSMMWCKQV